MPQIAITDLEVRCHVGVPDEERAQPQRLLISVDMEFDFRAAAASDDLAKTINYYEVAQRILSLGSGRSWKLIETLAAEVAATLLADFSALAVTVTVKKFIIPEAAHVSVTLTETRAE